MGTYVSDENELPVVTDGVFAHDDQNINMVEAGKNNAGGFLTGASRAGGTGGGVEDTAEKPHYHFDAEKGNDDIDPEENSPIEEVALTVPTGDDPTLPLYTWRMWILGFVVCSILSFIDQFFYYRAEPLLVSALTGQIISLYLGRFMAKTLPNKTFLWCPLNPGPFNMKEHVLITIFANAGYGFGYGNAWGIDLLTIIKVFYKLPLNFWVGMIIITCPQLLGYGWAGIMKKFLVEPASMWWPQNLVNVSLFRTLHEKEPKGGIKRIHFFGLVVLCSFLWYTVPGYLFEIATCFSWVCWAFPNSVIAQQLGSGFSGLGIGSFTLDWATLASFNGSPLAAPLFAILNVMAGFLFYFYIFIPCVYYNNVFSAKNFPILAKQLYLENGTLYDVTQIVDNGDVFNEEKYNAYGEVYLPVIYVFFYGINFAVIMASFCHVALHHGAEIVRLLRNTNKLDIHAKLMRRYPDLPRWWFVVIFIITTALSVGINQAIKSTMQIPWWGTIVVTVLAIIVTLPLSIIVATTNFLVGLGPICQLIGGYMFPGKPIANMITNVWIYGSVAQAVAFLQDFKLGHYMKIPPRTMFAVQLTGTIYAAIINYVVAWWQLTSIKNICNINVLSFNSPWTCPYDNIVYVNTIVWGLVGPQRVVGPRYSIVYWFLLIGALAPLPFYFLCKLLPNVKWIKHISAPLLFLAVSGVPPTAPANYICWGIVGVIFQYYLFNYHKKWWARYTYILSAGLETGIAFMAILLFFALQYENHFISYWGNQPDNCPLATCPIAPGLVTDGCPTFG